MRWRRKSLMSKKKLFFEKLACDYSLVFSEFCDQIGVDTKERVKIYDYGYEQ